MMDSKKPTSSSSALIRANIRKYGGYLIPPKELPNILQVQIIDMKLLDPHQIIETSATYNTSASSDSFYQALGEKHEDTALNTSAQIVILGRLESGHSICVRLPFHPFVFLYAPDVEWNNSEKNTMKNFIARALGIDINDIKIELHRMKRLYEWIPDPQDPTKTEELNVLKIYVPNKKLLDKLIDKLDPIKSYEKILHNTLDKIKDDLIKMESYKYANKKNIGRIRGMLYGLDKRLEAIKKNIENMNTDPDNLMNNKVGSSSRMPNQFPIPSITDLNFICDELKQVWVTWKQKYRNVYQAMEWFRKTGFKLSGFKKPIQTHIWESSVDLVHKFSDDSKIVSSGWVELTKYSKPDGYVSHSQIECCCTLENIRPIEKNAIAPLLVASVDGEMYTPNSRRFPNSRRKDNPVITIGVVLCRTNSTDTEKFVFCLKETDPVPDATMFWFETEQELLCKYRDFIAVEADPDFITGYNILGFDWKYFAERASEIYNDPNVEEEITAEDDADDDDDGVERKSKNFKVKKNAIFGEDEDEEPVEDIGGYSSQKHIVSNSRFFRLSRIWAEVTPCRPQVFRSNAYGERWSYHFDMTGRAVQDLLIYIRREHKLESYKLNAVSDHFLKDNKIDLDHKLLFKYYETGPKERSLIAEYCVKDCILPINLCKHPKLMVIQNLIEMSRVTYTPLPQIINRGQQIKVFNQLVWYAHLHKFVMNDQPHREVDEYEGATVLDPKSGWYDNPITVLDFAALYPVSHFYFIFSVCLLCMCVYPFVLCLFYHMRGSDYYILYKLATMADLAYL